MKVAADSEIAGERARSIAYRDRSVHARATSAVAAGLVLILGLGLLAWYYSHLLKARKRVDESGHAAAIHRAQSEMALPPLSPLAESADATAAGAAGSAPAPVGTEIPLSGAQLPLTETKYGSAAGSAPRSRHERLLSGEAFAHGVAGTQGAGVARDEAANLALSSSGSPPQGQQPQERGDPDRTLTTLLRPPAISTIQAQLLPPQRFLLARGDFIDCTLETAIDSTLPGMTTCITATDTFGKDGKVVLLERGTKLVGETRGEVRQGTARVFVLWTEARTPTGVVVPLDSPGTDELGRSGLPGTVNRHFLDRFGAAILISLVDGAVQSAVQSRRTGSGTVVYGPAGAQDVLSEVLKSTLNIAPSVIKRQGDRIQILVAHDVDFRTVYQLRSAATAE